MRTFGGWLLWCRRLHRSLILAAAYVDGLLSFDGATLDEGLTADGSRVGRSYSSPSFTAGGEVSLVGAHVSTGCGSESATLLKRGHRRGAAGGLEHVLPEGQKKKRAPAARMSVDSSHSTMPSSTIVDRLQVEQDMSCEEGFCAKGEAALRSVRRGTAELPGSENAPRAALRDSEAVKTCAAARGQGATV